MRDRCVFSLWLALSLIAGCSWLHGQPPRPTPEFQAKYRAALEAFNENDYEMALTLLNEAEQIQPGMEATLNLKGASHVKLKNFQEAANAFRGILAQKPQNPVALFNYGETLFLSKNYPQAKEAFQKYMATEGNANNALGRLKVFLCDLLMGNEQAVQEMIANLKPTISHPLEYYCRAARLFHQGNEEEARGYLNSAFEIYPAGMNLAFADSFVELGWLKSNEIAEIGAVDASALQSLSQEFQPQETETGIDAEQFESLLPALE